MPESAKERIERRLQEIIDTAYEAGGSLASTHPGLDKSQLDFEAELHVIVYFGNTKKLAKRRFKEGYREYRSD